LTETYAYKKFWIAVGLVWLWLAVCPGWPAAAQPANPLGDLNVKRREVAARMEAATVWVVGHNGYLSSTGSGFVVAPGVVLTNAHVVSGLGKKAEFFVVNQQLPVTSAKVTAVDMDPRSDDSALGGRDFALLEFKMPKGVILPVLSFNLDARKMDWVGAWGFPAVVVQFNKSIIEMEKGNDIEDFVAPPVVFTDGSVNTLVEAELGKVIIHSANISSGNSGGPLVNFAGEVIGINTWRFSQEKDLTVLNFALSAEDILEFLTEKGIEPNLAEGQVFIPSGTKTASLSNNKSGSKADRATGRLRVLESFSVEVPQGWGVLEEDDDSIVLMTDDLQTFLGVMVTLSDGEKAEFWAEQYSLDFGGSRPIETDGVYVFQVIEDFDDVTIVAVTDISDEKHTVLYINGNIDAPGLDDILESLQNQ
jgi:S1-C subfamily serine protease